MGTVDIHTILEDLKKTLEEFTFSLKGAKPSINNVASITLSPKYAILLDKLNPILDMIIEDIKSFTELDIKTEIKNGDTVIAFYETKYEINGNITETFPQTTDPSIMERHIKLVDKSIKERKEVIIEIIKIISTILKFTIP